MKNSPASPENAEQPNPVRLDAIDQRILAELACNAKIPNNVLAAKLHIAPSTCLARVKLLTEAKIIQRYSAQIDLALLGYLVFVLISLRVHPSGRSRMSEISTQLSKLPNVLSVFVLAGDTDFILHVGFRTTLELEEFISTQLGANPEIANIRTSLIFDYKVSTGLKGFVSAAHPS